MKPKLMPGVALATGLLSCFASFAQPGAMRAPVLPQAIETHLQQQRTLEQREAIEAKVVAPDPAPTQPALKKPAAKKAKKAQSQRPPAALVR